MSMKNSDTSWDRTSDLPICSTAPKPLCHRGPPPWIWWIRKSCPLCELELCRQVHSPLNHQDQPSYTSSILKVGGLHNMHEMLPSSCCVRLSVELHKQNTNTLVPEVCGNSAFIQSLIFINAEYKQKLW